MDFFMDNHNTPNIFKCCMVDQCKYLHTHTTPSHTCGKCGRLGHGQLECGKTNKINYLTRYNNDELPMNKWCSIPGCNYKKYHTNESHHCRSCKERASHSAINCPSNPRRFNQVVPVPVPGPVPGPVPDPVPVPVPDLTNIINKKCPICRIDSDIDTNTTLFTGAECCICMDSSKKMIIFKNCSHAQVCSECVLKL